eukprot:COSAG01_NODE_8078_length_2930_cov_1.918403_5_plen_31_part_01
MQEERPNHTAATHIKRCLLSAACWLRLDSYS